jgi:3-oxocholest-4-en-26-oyl-CoA dehydrogenase beta subunit
MTMDFEISADARELADLTKRIVHDRLSQHRLRELDEAPERFDPQLWAALVDAEVLDADLGAQGDAAVLVELGRQVAPVPYLWSVAVAARSLARFGRADLADEVTSGRLLVTVGLTEDLNDAPEAPATAARRTNGNWELDGVKAVVPHGTIADLFLIPAATDQGARVFLVRSADPAVRVQAQTVVDGDTEATVELAGVPVAEDAVLGGADTLPWLIARATAGLCAWQLGVLERALELTAGYAREREQFGRPIGSFQAVAQRLADTYIDVEAVRLTAWEAIWRLDAGLPASAELATAKFWAADAGHRVAHTAVHVHGGTGIDMEGEVHRYFVAAKRAEFALGGATTQLRRLGAELAGTPV